MKKDKLELRIKDYILSEKISDALGLGKDFKVGFLAQGEYNKNYVLYDENKKYVFRINTESQLKLDNQIEYEYGALKALEISEVTPKAFYVDGSKEQFNYGVLIMEYLKGRPLRYELDLSKAGNIFGRIHSIKTEGLKEKFIYEEDILSQRVKESRQWLEQFFVNTKASKEQQKFFYDYLDWAEKNRYREKYFKKEPWNVINNTEVNSNNFIIGEKKNYLIDWEKPVISDPAQDITHFLSETTTLWKTDCILSDRDKEIFLNSYVDSLEEKDKDIRERVRIYTPYLYLRALSWCAYAFVEYQNPKKTIRNEDTLKKINQYLDCNFMKKLTCKFM